MGVAAIDAPQGYEADDTIAAYAKQAESQGWLVTVVSNDKDLLQLVSDNVRVYDPYTEEFRDAKFVFGKYGVQPRQMPDMQALMGDKADNVPGVPGIGEKSAQKLIQEYGNIEDMLQRLGSVETTKAVKVKAHASTILQNLELVRLDTGTPQPLPLDQLRVTFSDKSQEPISQHGEKSETGEASISTAVHGRDLLFTTDECEQRFLAKLNEYGLKSVVKSLSTALTPLADVFTAQVNMVLKHNEPTPGTAEMQDYAVAETAAPGSASSAATPQAKLAPKQKATAADAAAAAPKQKAVKPPTKKEEQAAAVTEKVKEGCYLVVDHEQALDELIAFVRKKRRATFRSLISVVPNDSDRRFDLNLCGIAVSIRAHKGYYVPLLHKHGDVSFERSVELLARDPMFQKLKQLMLDESVVKVFHNAKEEIKHLFPYLGEHPLNYEDVMVMSYVRYCGLPGQHGPDIEPLNDTLLPTKEVEGVTILGDHVALVAEKDIVGTGKGKLSFAKVDPQRAALFACQYADLTARLYSKIMNDITSDPLKERLMAFYKEVELPMVGVLADLEIHGVKVDDKSLADMALEYSHKIDDIHERIADLSGKQELNINSPQQLGEVLFDEMGLKMPSKDGKSSSAAAKSDKSGHYVVDQKTLDLLAKQGVEIAKLLIQYRALTKLQSTYIIGLKEHVNKYTGRIHTTYQNALTVTGRLSCTAPNLQNIPIRTPEGKEIRKKFIAPPGHRIVKADYSQVELRILAHKGSIDVLRDAFLNGKDVHSITASQVFNVPVEQVDKDMRRKAKAINFGIIYGMSSFGLAAQLNVSKEDAQGYIDKYFKQYPGIKKYMDETKAKCKRDGYVETVFGRRCYVPGINDPDKGKRGFAERTCINTPIQGTSADITKKAMIGMSREIKRRGLKTRMIIQVHDEIVFEVPEDEIEAIQPVIKEVMEGVANQAKPPFSVPLTVDINIADNWVGDD